MAEQLIDWMEVREQGLYCRPADLYIDPMQPVDNAVITHGHADHARAGHRKVWATAETLDIMTIRYGVDHAQQTAPLPYGVKQDFGPVSIRLEPAGHILGSAQVVLQYSGQTVVVSGDYKRQDDPTCEPFHPVPCDVFITEATFALPVFHHPPISGEVQKLVNSLQQFPDRCHLVGVYALGKCQRLLIALRDAGYDKPVYVHGALIKLCQYYEEKGFALGTLIPVAEVPSLSSLAGEIVLCPPSALASQWSRKLPRVRTAMASGWMQIRARSKQRQAELPLIISDHADWQGLLSAIDDIKPGEIWVTHGREDALVHQCQSKGYKARALSLLGYSEESEA